MMPALNNGSLVVVDKQASPQKGDIVVAYSDYLQSRIIKRVVAVEGETVAMQDGKLSIDGVEIEEPYVAYQNADNEACWGEYEVQKGSYFLLGDNRLVSVDSHVFGSVDEVEGVVLFHIF